MAHLNHDNPFQSWVLTPEEFLQGTILTITQKQCIQNQIVTLAITKNNIRIDPLNPLSTLQEEAEIRGQLTALQYLLDLSASSEAQMNPGARKVNVNIPESKTPPQA